MTDKNSEIKEIDRLIDRFADNNITPEDQESLIRLLGDEDNADILAGLESRLAAAIDRAAESEDVRGRIRVKEHGKVRRWRILAGIAASVAVALTLGVHLLNRDLRTAPPTPRDTYTNPEDAYAEVQNALEIFSTTLGKGMRQVEMVENTTADIQSKITSQLQKTSTTKNDRI